MAAVNPTETLVQRYIQEVADSAPPLTSEQRRRPSTLLTPVRRSYGATSRDGGSREEPYLPSSRP